MPASVYGLSTKGIIREGFDADICIFDADRIIDNADYINCHNRCEGLNYVILGGKTVVKDAVYNGTKKGKFMTYQR
jgi:N-acyl-D-amino-acid deacylase